MNLELICPIQNYYKQSFIPNTPEFSQSLSRWWFSYMFIFTAKIGGSWSKLTCTYVSNGWWEIHQLILMLYAVINSISPVDDGKSRVIYRVSYMSGFLTTDFVMFLFPWTMARNLHFFLRSRQWTCLLFNLHPCWNATERTCWTSKVPLLKPNVRGTGKWSIRKLS